MSTSDNPILSGATTAFVYAVDDNLREYLKNFLN